jgi:hypothetical protein
MFLTAVTRQLDPAFRISNLLDLNPLRRPSPILSRHATILGAEMARLNAGYGSELHLLRMLGRHREYFNGKIRDATGADGIEWLDFPSGDGRTCWGK